MASNLKINLFKNKNVYKMYQRLKAGLIDYIISIIISAPIFILFFGKNDDLQHFELLNANSDIKNFSVFCFNLLILTLPFIFKDAFFKRSVGKMLYNLKVIDINKQTISTYKLIIRNITLVFVIIEILFLAITQNRLGDIITKTTVVSDISKEKINVPKVIIAIILNFVISYFLVFSLYYCTNTNKVIQSNEVLIERDANAEQNMRNLYPKDIDSCSIALKKVEYNNQKNYVSVLVYVNSSSNQFKKENSTRFLELIKDEVVKSIYLREGCFLHIQCKKNYYGGGHLISKKSYSIDRQ